MRTEYELKTIRRKNANGYHYFIANLSPRDIHQTIKLAVPFKEATWFNPLNGDIRKATFENNAVTVSLRSGESMILQTFNEGSGSNQCKADEEKSHGDIMIKGPWTLSFTEEAPHVGKTYQMKQLQTWETLDELTRVTMGTGIYETTFKLTKKDVKAGPWKIDLGDVRESARVYINDTFIGCAWSVPFILDTRGTLKAGKNTLRIEVTNLPANRISELDREGVKWRKMEEINVVDINYKKTLYDRWEPVESGLATEIKLIK